MAETEEQAVAQFREHFGGGGSPHLGWSPGRINLIGEYTDLNRGRVLPMAIDLGIAAIVRWRTDNSVSGYSTALGAHQTASLDAAPEEVDGWLAYIVGTAALLREAGCPIRGFDLLVHASLPQGGGVSSSAALTTATCMALQSASGWTLDAIASATLCQQVEHRYANVMCGLMDQLACRLGKQDFAVHIDCNTLECELVPFPSEEVALLVVDSGVPRTLHATEYNARREQCFKAVAELSAIGKPVSCLAEVSLRQLAAAQNRLSPTSYRRAYHVVTENQRVADAREALLTGDVATLGQLMYQSHTSLAEQFEVSIPELDHIVAVASGCDGALGARLTGAGFGGNAIVLVEKAAAATVARRVSSEFAERFGRPAPSYPIGPTAAAHGYPV